MFKGKIDSNDTTATPERVFTLCKLLEKGASTEDEIREMMEPAYLGNSTRYFQYYKRTAEDLGLITISDKTMDLAVDREVIKSTDNMRKYINMHLEQFSGEHFYALTNAYFEIGNDIFKKEKNIANLGPFFSEITGKEIDAYSMRAWRFWVTFLGLGYLQDMFVIPNAYVFLRDVIEGSELEKGKLYSASEFIQALSPMTNIIISNIQEKRFNYGTSNGLRALQDAGIIRMEHILDQGDMWTLYPLKAYSNDSIITHITIV